MRIALLAATLAASPAAGAHERPHKVCLVTFENPPRPVPRRMSAMSSVHAMCRWRPLSSWKAAPTTSATSIPSGRGDHGGPWIDFSYDGTGTRDMCKDLAELAEGADWDD